MSALRILFLATEWASGHGGVSTFNRELVTAVARIPDVEVWCALPRRPPDREIVGARDGRVHFLHARECPVPEGNDLFLLAGPMQRLDGGADAGQADALAGLDPHAVVGHGRWTGPAAVQLAARHGIAVRGHIVHVDPRIVEASKNRASPGARSDHLCAVERGLGEPTNVAVFGVGPRITRGMKDGEGFARTCELVPGLSAQPEQCGGRARHALLIGRLEDSHLKGLDVAVRELHEAAADGRVYLELRGAENEANLTERVEALLKSHGDSHLDGRLQVLPTPFTTDGEFLSASYRNAQLVLMPSREEGFGLVGLEAIARGRPVMISQHSGLAGLSPRKVMKRPTAHSCSIPTSEVRWPKRLGRCLRIRRVRGRWCFTCVRAWQRCATGTGAREHLSRVSERSSGSSPRRRPDLPAPRRSPSRAASRVQVRRRRHRRRNKTRSRAPPTDCALGLGKSQASGSIGPRKCVYERSSRRRSSAQSCYSVPPALGNRRC